MTRHDAQAFAASMMRLAEAYGEVVTAARIDVYFEALEDYELEYIEPAIRYLIRTSKWFPKPSEIREQASRMRGEVRRQALMVSKQLAIPERVLSLDEVKAFLAELRTRPEHAEQIREGPLHSLERLRAESDRLEAMGAREMTDEKRRALENFRRFNEERR